MLSLPDQAQGQLDPATKQLSHDIFQQLIEINTTDTPQGNVTTAAKAMQQRFLDAGFAPSDAQLLGPNDRKQNLVVRLHGTGAHQPILLIGHLDVVQALPSDWTTDPFKFIEKDGYYYGRGTQDMKGDDATLITTFIRFKKEGFKPDRDLILALTADEEGGKSNGVDWLVKNHRDLVNAAYVLNADGGGVRTEQGKPVYISISGSEKLYGDYQLTTTDPGGHSSLPRPDNAIYELTDGLNRLEAYKFPFELNPVTRGYFERMSTIDKGQTAADMKAILGEPPDAAAIQRLSADPDVNALLRTTCVATRLEGGHANNALPAMARANVNCRILPGNSREEVRQELIRVLNDPKITVRYEADNHEVSDRAPDAKALPPAAPSPEVMQTLEKIGAEMWPGVPVVPTMEAGASDGVYTNGAGMPTYMVSGMALDGNDIRAHGKDERLPAKSFYDGVDFYYRFLKTLTSAP